MEMLFSNVQVAVEEWEIPTYPMPEAEEMPMFSETSVHQGTTGNPYPMRVVSYVENEKVNKKWTVIRLENDFIRLALIPDLGGRVFEAYDKVTGYDFFYRQHVIKPALIGAYGSWISGGLEFNWPFHHRPSTVMPVDYEVCREDDGSVIVWMSEHAPNDRTKGMVGIVLKPDASYFETRVSVTNRTSQKRNFLWWENAAVPVHEGYRLVFPPDVTWVHHHNDAYHTTFPFAFGQYGADNIQTPKDISWHKNSKIATSYFAANSKYDFFGGYDHIKNCGVLHIANHHTAPGKKMFTWGYGLNAENWERKLTDTDGAYAELMAGSYTNDQPDFTWLAPYETKTFSQYWYPTQGIGYTSFANLDAAVSLDREAGQIRFNTTRIYSGVKITVKNGSGKVLLEKTADFTPSSVVSYNFDYPENEKLTVCMVKTDGAQIMCYTEEVHDDIHIPDDNKGIPMPSEIETPCELVIAGSHIDQYRNPFYKPDIYYLEALKRDPNYLPALKGLGEYYTRVLRYDEALLYLDRAWKIECRYNQNPEDGQVGYLRGICLKQLGKTDEAYDALYRASWSYNVISPAMAMIAAIDGMRGDFKAMYEHAVCAINKEINHPLATPYAALALWKMGDTRGAARICRQSLKVDALNHLVRYVLTIVTGNGKAAFLKSLNADPVQTALDIGFDLIGAGFVKEAVDLFEGVRRLCENNAMLDYTMAYCYEILGNKAKATRCRNAAKKNRIVSVFPMRGEEKTVLEFALKTDPKDGLAAYLLGCLVYNSQLYNDAAQLWQQAIKNIPDFYIPYRNLALVYFNHLDRIPDALELMQKAVSLEPQNCILWSELSEVMLKNRRINPESAAFIEQNKPDKVTDQFQLALARTYNAAGQFELAEKTMRSHIFSPGEGAEFETAEPYIYSCFARGRKALADGRYKEALSYFRASQQMPKNLTVGFWNESVMMPYLYFEAVALKALGQDEEADKIITRLAGMRNAGMWNMGAEFIYYYAMAVKLGGEETRARQIMREATLLWEKELANGCENHRVMSILCRCFVGNGTVNRVATLNGMLGYARLFDGDVKGAKEYFARSIDLSYNPKIAFELELLQG